MALRNIKKPIEDCKVGETIDLEQWFRDEFTPSWIKSIEKAFYQWSEDFWHDEEIDECSWDEDGDCSCPEPDPAKVAAGRVWDFVKNEYIEIEDMEFSDTRSWVTIQIDFHEEDVPPGLTKFALNSDTIVTTGDYEDVPDQQEKTKGVSQEGPLQPPKDFTKGLVVESNGPDLPKIDPNPWRS